jgi:abnormal spindle-like microcephaly-associated protein
MANTGGLCLQVILYLFQTGLWGEGSLLRHLKPYQYTLSHEQSPLNELNFDVVTLPADLRDGLRLCKLTEILTGMRLNYPGLAATVGIP